MNEEVEIRKIYMPTDEEEAEIQAQIARDPDAHEADEAHFVASFGTHRFKTVLVEGEENRPFWPDPKIHDLVELPIDSDVAPRFLSSRQGWKALIRAVLRQAAFGNEGQEPDSARVETVPDRPATESASSEDPAGQFSMYIYIDKDVVAYFKAQGENWKDLMNATLRRAAFAEEVDLP